MQRSITFKVILFLFILLFFTEPAFSENSYLKIEGPKVDGIYYVLITEPTAARMALERGDIDILPDLVNPVDINYLARLKNITITASRGFHMFYMAFNTKRYPWSEKVIRQAVAYVVPKKEIVKRLFAGYALPLDSFVVDISPYYNPDVKKYDYNPKLARELLKKAGFRFNKEGYLINPKTNKPFKEFKLYSPTYEVAPTSAETGKIIAQSITKFLGIPVKLYPMDFSSMIQKVNQRDFDLFVMAWSLSKNPDYLYSFFHSVNDIEGGYNFPGLRDKKLDEVLDKLYHAKDQEEAKKYAFLAQKMLSDLVPYVLIYSRYLITAFRNDWEGIISAKGYSGDNFWTYLNIHPKGKSEGGILKVRMPIEPRSLNPLIASTAYEWDILGKIYESLLATDPYSLKDIPWLAESWTVKVIEQGNEKKHVFEFKIKKGITWQDGKPFTAKDVAFTFNYLIKNKPPRFLDSVRDIEKVELIDDYTVKFYMKGISYWYLDNIGGVPILPEHIWKDVKDYKLFYPWKEKLQGTNLYKLIGTGPFIYAEHKVGSYVYLKANKNYWYKNFISKKE